MILGGEATIVVWSCKPRRIIDSRIWPRTAAACRTTLVARNSVMWRRCNADGDHLAEDELYGCSIIQLYRDVEPHAGEGGSAAAAGARGCGQPPRNTRRGQLREYDAFSPLSTFDRAVSSEKRTARKFWIVVDRIIAGKASRRIGSRRRNGWLKWRDNGRSSTMLPSLNDERLGAGFAPRCISFAGRLDAIGYLAEIPPCNARLENGEVAFCESEKPQAVLLNMVAPAVLKWCSHHNPFKD